MLLPLNGELDRENIELERVLKRVERAERTIGRRRDPPPSPSSFVPFSGFTAEDGRLGASSRAYRFVHSRSKYSLHTSLREAEAKGEITRHKRGLTNVTPISLAS